MKKLKKLTVVLLCCMLLVGQMLTVTASAAQKISLTVEYKHENLPISGAQFDIYKIADVNNKGEISAVSPFNLYALDFSKIDSETMNNLALTLTAFIARDGVKPYDSAVTDLSGKAEFPNSRKEITKGLYLIIGRDTKADGVTYSTDAFLTLLPATGSDGTPSCNVTAKPKATEKDETGERKIKVLKVWNDNNSAERPKEITVDLIKNGKVADTVVLSKANNWRHSWEKLDASAEYHVAERGAPDGYTVLTKLEGVTFIITNTKKPSEEPTTKPTAPEDTTAPDSSEEDTTSSDETTKENDKKPDLPQTGMLRWPIPYLACAGLVLFMAGWVRHRKSEIENEK